MAFVWAYQYLHACCLKLDKYFSYFAHYLYYFYILFSAWNTSCFHLSRNVLWFVLWLVDLCILFALLKQATFQGTKVSLTPDPSLVPNIWPILFSIYFFNFILSFISFKFNIFHFRFIALYLSHLLQRFLPSSNINWPKGSPSFYWIPFLPIPYKYNSYSLLSFQF